jgi:HD superfamily phosphohydrolase
MQVTEPANAGDLSPDEIILNNFFAKLENLYLSDVNLSESWAIEEPPLRTIMAEVVREIAFNYTLGAPLGVGGSGVVAIVQDNNLKRKRALKVSRPSPGKEKMLTRILRSETRSLLRLSHPHLIQIFAQGAISQANHDYPYYVMEFVEGVLDSDKYFEQPGRTRSEVLKVFTGILQAVDYLHQQGTIHMDLKPGNVLVTPSCVPVISDLGFAKQLLIGDDWTLIGGTEGFIHPGARKLVQEAQSDPNRLRGEANRNLLETAWDLYSLGKTFLKLLRVLEENNPKALSSYDRRYLKLLSCRLLDGHNTDNERALGLSLSTLKEIKYQAVAQAKIDMEKLSGAYNLESRIPELDLHIQDTIQASTLATTPFTGRVKEILKDPAVMRLGGVSQLGLLNLIYPTATHTRLEHVIGTFSALCRYIVALYNDPLNPLFRQIMDEKDLRAALLASLLHDIGHYPLAHDFEEADFSLFSHEQFGEDFLGDRKNSLAELLEKEDGWDTSVDRILAILKAEPQSLKGTLKDRILHTLISGPVDADKIDYLMRDSLRLGLNYGKIIDLERLLRTLTIVFREQDTHTYAALGIHEKGKVPAEAVAFARYAMFGQVYWHHAYRSIKAMLHRMIWETLELAKDEKVRKQFRDTFRDLVAPTGKSKKQQGLLFTPDDFAAGATREVSQILHGDLAMLQWLSEQCGDIGLQFLSLLKTRNLFKRILVLSSEKIPDKHLWDNLSDFYRTNKRNWRKKRRLQIAFQKRIVELVENPPEAPTASLVITDTARNKFIVAGRETVILLVDLPPERKGSTIPLEFIIEEDRRRVKSDEMRTGSLEHSIVWRALQDSFQESIGKLRVFCHPEHSEFLSAYLSRPTIENALASSLVEVEQE